MRRRTLLRLLAAEFFARLWNAPAWAQQWREYRNDEGGYRIDLPGQPKITSEAEGSDGTDKRTTVELDVDDLTIAVAHWSHQMEMSRMDDFLELVRDDIAKTLGGKMRSETRSVIGGFTTLDVVYDANGIAFAIMRLVLTPRRAIQILIQANRSLDGNRIVERMLRSFAPLP